jgi:hypothetical protein
VVKFALSPLFHNNPVCCNKKPPKKKNGREKEKPTLAFFLSKKFKFQTYNQFEEC